MPEVDPTKKQEGQTPVAIHNSPDSTGCDTPAPRDVFPPYAPCPHGPYVLHNPNLHYKGNLKLTPNQAYPVYPKDNAKQSLTINTSNSNHNVNTYLFTTYNHPVQGCLDTGRVSDSQFSKAQPHW